MSPHFVVREAGPYGCRCSRQTAPQRGAPIVRVPPVLWGTWRDGALVDVRRRHTPDCGLPDEVLDPRDWEA